jgi:hypothetical protein
MPLSATSGGAPAPRRAPSCPAIHARSETARLDRRPVDVRAPGIVASRAWWGRLAAAALAFALGLALPANAAPATPIASEQEASEYQVKAHFLTQFIKYATWPPEAFGNDKAPFVVLVVGEDPFGEHLEKAFSAKKGPGGRSIRLVRAKDLDELPRAHLIFLARSHADRLDTLLEGPSGRGALIVGDSESLAERGAHVNLFLENKRTRFEVNVEASKRSGLALSPEMLKLARIVPDRRRQQEP